RTARPTGRFISLLHPRTHDGSLAERPYLCGEAHTGERLSGRRGALGRHSHSRQMKTPGRGHFFFFKALRATAARTRALRARSLTLSPSRKSIARHLLPSRPALKSLSGSGRLAPSKKVSLALSLWALKSKTSPSW